MSYGQYYQYPAHSHGQALLPTNVLNYGQIEDRGSKSPLSLINHPRHSPGPLSTPPHSRNTSQPPEREPDQMVYDDVGGSQSDSPTSIPTPDFESFEIEMLDAEAAMREFYHHNHSVAMVSTQMQQDPIPAMDTDFFLSNQALHDAYNASVIPQNVQYHAPLSLQTQPFQQVLPSQPFNQTYGQNYTDQPPHHDPWTSQRPQQNPNVPRSGGVVFDPQSDPMDYSAYVNFEVNNWTHHNTDPNYLVSPNEPLPQSQEHHFNYPAPTQQIQQTHRPPLNVRLIVPSPPQASHTFVNYNQDSRYFTEEPVPDPQFPPPSPNTSSMGSSFGQLAHSPYQVSISPQASSPRPGSESRYSAYQNSDSGMEVSSYGGEQFNPTAMSQTSSLRVDPSPTRSVPEVTFKTTPEPESGSRATSTGRGSGRPGGRALGTHLDPKKAKDAHDMRKIVTCWHCALQRDKCGPGDICERCVKRSQRPNADRGLGCSRVKLIDLAPEFLPTLVTQMHEDSHLTQFVNKHIRSWGNVELTIYLTCGQETMPRIPVKVYEFTPNGDELLVQIQYLTDPETQRRVAVTKKSPALGMMYINHNEEKKYDEYISRIVDNHLDDFGELCWAEDDRDFQQKLFRLLTRVKPKSDDETKLLREVNRLIVVTYIMSHVLTITEDSKHATLSRMHSYDAQASYNQTFTCPRMANRQLKYFFSRIQRSILSTVLSRLQQIFKSSKGCDKWLAAFVAVIGMCMAHEDQQKTIHLVQETKARTEGLDPRDAQNRADVACRGIDEHMLFIQRLFRWKYNRKCNPLRDAEHAWDREVGFGDQDAVTFVRQVVQLIKDNNDFLQTRQHVSISHANQTQYTSRLVAQFLLSFWIPS